MVATKLISWILLSCELDNALNIKCINESKRANQAEGEAKIEKDRADKLESCKQNTIYKLLPTLPSFTGRDIEINDLHTMIENKKDGQLGIVLCGMGGIGKSELARAYANEKKKSF